MANQIIKHIANVWCIYNKIFAQEEEGTRNTQRKKTDQLESHINVLSSSLLRLSRHIVNIFSRYTYTFLRPQHELSGSSGTQHWRAKTLGRSIKATHTKFGKRICMMFTFLDQIRNSCFLYRTLNLSHISDNFFFSTKREEREKKHFISSTFFLLSCSFLAREGRREMKIYIFYIWRNVEL